MAQRSNRQHLVEGALRCMQRLPPERVTARAIADEAGANIASITYHFGSKDDLITEAVVTGLDRWLTDIAGWLGADDAQPAAARLDGAIDAVAATREHRLGLARMFVVAVTRAQHDQRIRNLLTAGFRHARPDVAAVLHLGDDPEGHDAGGLVLALFHGLLLQVLVDPSLAIDGDRMRRAQERLGWRAAASRPHDDGASA